MAVNISVRRNIVRAHIQGTRCGGLETRDLLGRHVTLEHKARANLEGRPRLGLVCTPESTQATDARYFGPLDKNVRFTAVVPVWWGLVLPFVVDLIVTVMPVVVVVVVAVHVAAGLFAVNTTMPNTRRKQRLRKADKYYKRGPLLIDAKGSALTDIKRN